MWLLIKTETAAVGYTLQDRNLMLSSVTDQELGEKLCLFVTWNSEYSHSSGTRQLYHEKPALDFTIISTLKMVKIHSTEVSNTVPKSLSTAVTEVDDRMVNGIYIYLLKAEFLNLLISVFHRTLK